MAKRLFDAFLSKQQTIKEHATLTCTTWSRYRKTSRTYPDRSLNAPDSQFFDASKKRIHQNLAAANWDLDKANAIYSSERFRASRVQYSRGMITIMAYL